MRYENSQLSPEQENYASRAEERELKLEAAGQLRELADQVYDLIEEMRDVLRDAAPTELNSAEAYWMAHIDGALENRGGYLGTSMISLNDTVEALEQEDQE